MNKTAITLLNYENEKCSFEIDLENVLSLVIQVISGDEVLVVVDNCGHTKLYDSSTICPRLQDFYDGEYEIYNSKTGINHLNDNDFLNRKTSYEYLRGE